jgi:hypothetical protein
MKTRMSSRAKQIVPISPDDAESRDLLFARSGEKTDSSASQMIRKATHLTRSVMTKLKNMINKSKGRS